MSTTLFHVLFFETFSLKIILIVNFKWKVGLHFSLKMNNNIVKHFCFKMDNNIFAKWVYKKNDKK